MRRARMIAAVLLAIGAATARAQDPPEPSPRAAPARIPIAGYELVGTRVDPDGRLLQLLAAIAPIGEPFVDAGPSDDIGRPLGTIPRLVQALDAVGYRGAITRRAAAGGVVLTAALTPYDRVRYVFVSGNWPIQQDEIQRRISIRPGRPLPPPGPERTAALERERDRVIDFLRGQGYFEANVRIDATAGLTAAGSSDLHVTVALGPAYPLGPITVTGNRLFDSDTIEALFRHADWVRLWTRPVAFTQKQLRQDLDALTKRYRERGYAGARVTSDFNAATSVDRAAKNVRLAINVVERKRITVVFEGNASESAGALRDELTLFARGSYDDYEVGASADALWRHYQQQGHLLARVTWRRERVSDDEERIVFTIEEGPTLKVRAVEFAGNASLPARELANVVSVRTYPPLGIGSGGYVTGRQMQQDVERLVEHYRDRGFLEVKVDVDAATSRAALGALGAMTAAADTTSRAAGDLYLRFSIVEGPRVTLASLALRSADGALPYDGAFLTRSLSLRVGAPYTPAAVRADGKRLARLLGDAGYPTATVDPEVTRAGDRVALVWTIKLGPRVRVGPIFVRGNFVTTRQTILEQIPLAPGGYLTTTAVERGQRNLGFLQLFNNASPISFPGKDDKLATVPMVVEVEERYEQYSVLHFGVGASTEQVAPNSSLPFGFYGRVGYENRDLAGHGWNFLGQITYGTALLRGNVSFLDRRFLGTLFAFDASLTFLDQSTVRLGDIRSGGGSIGFSREMYPGIDAGIHYNLRNTTHTEPLLRVAGPDESQQNIQIGTTVGSVSANVEWLRMDNRLLPTRGFRIDAVTEFAVPALSVPLRPLPIAVGDDTFLKVGVHELTVIPLGHHIYLRHGFRYDQGFPFGGASLLPKVERFFAGGDTTIRGYQLDRARTEVVQQPLIPFDPTLARTTGLYAVEFRPLGGNLRVLQNIDLQFPIIPPWYGAVFMDNGVVADSFDGLSFSQFRHGVGFSPLLIRLPIGDLSLAWGVPLDPGPGDSHIGVLHVNVGLLF